MKQYLAQRVHNLKPSPVFALVKRAKELEKQGLDLVNLSIGEPEWETFNDVKQAGIQAIEQGYTKYTSANGREGLRQQLAELQSKEWNLPINKDQITITSGCKLGLFTVFQCLCEQNEEVILPSPYWVSYTNIIELSGAKVKIIPTSASSGFKIQASQLQDACTSQTKCLLLNSPNNPTSAVYSKKELQELAEVLRSHPNIFIVTDDIYSELVHEGSTAPHILQVAPWLRDRVIAINGASKSWLMTGWRLAWITAHLDLIKVFSSFQSQSISCANSISQRALETSLKTREKNIKELKTKLLVSKNNFEKQLKTIPGLKVYPSEGGFYFWVGVKELLGKKHGSKKINSSMDMMEGLLEEGLLCLPGENFGAPDYLRFNYSVNKTSLERAIKRLSLFVSKLT